MPPPRKIDLLPEELRRWLREELEQRGFGDILDVTEALNFRLQEEGLELSIGKTAVGDFSKALKDQREAFSIAEALLSDMDIEQEGELHRTLVQMLATSAIHMITDVRNKDGHLEPKDLMALGRMLKDVMASSGMREKLLADERARIEAEARRKAQAEMVEALDAAAEDEAGLSEAAIERLKKKFLGVKG